MEQFKLFLKHSQTLSAIGIILILFSVLDIMAVKILGFKVQLAFAVAILGLYHILRPIVQLIEPEN